MTVRITIDAPDELGPGLERVQNRLVKVLERGLREVLADEAQIGHDERQIMAVLAAQPSTEAILALRPSNAIQERASQLLTRSKESGLSPHEAAELERYLLLEHLVRLAKGHAYQRRGAGA